MIGKRAKVIGAAGAAVSAAAIIAAIAIPGSSPPQRYGAIFPCGGPNHSSVHPVCGNGPQGPAVPVGAPEPAGVTCSTTLNAGQDVDGAVGAATPGQTVCLNPGAWSSVVITSRAPASCCVTLAATPGQTVNIAGLELNGDDANLIIEGFTITATALPYGNPTGIALFGGASNVTLKYNTIENMGEGYAIHAQPTAHGGTHTQANVTVTFNQIDKDGTGIEIEGGRTEQSNWTITHNVIGPNINYQNGLTAACNTGGESCGHYIEIGGVAGATVSNNAFEGPEALPIDTDVAHLNVLHVDGGQTNVTFDNNIIWHSQSRAQTVLIQDQPLDNIDVDNNLFVEDPTCEADTNCNTSATTVYASHGQTFNNNTIVNAAWSVSLSQTGLGYPDPQSMTATKNISAPISALGSASQPNYGDWTCTLTCSSSSNTSADGSASSTFGGSGNVNNWTAAWTATTWTPIAGPGYHSPPAGYYQPTGLGISGAGYQGTIGP